ncbi:OmpA family protein [Rhizobium lusitanum]|uniref:Outer membrane protein OmpA-like peptidoglycan-associated protein n=1 Tax=Rhizobium lusitanum TaxID=293958 RepID=A0A7X0IQ04_9HYPH|nr:OmpA family protein [Rhizobium lusitanum]MBB6483571.1 outer membrane protein OmpA-like peptidoglycan-associated protein [Rhizobium lusitanum]
MVAGGSDSTPKLEHKGYNRGLILGLTMAESMLLLVFCLLLVAAALISAERSKRYEVERKLEKAEQQVAVLEKKRAEQAAELVLLQSKVVSGHLSAEDKAVVDKQWRELVLAKDTLDNMADQGATPDDLKSLAKVAAVLKEHDVALASASDEISKLLAGNGGGNGMHDWPPIINLDDAKKNYFQSGSAELTGTFAQLLDGTITDEIASNLNLYGANIVEVIGHTDEQPVSREKSNLDDTLISAISGKLPVSALQPADNAGLGLARAIAVANVLKANPKLKDATILPMSAAQLILPGDTITSGQRGAVESRRRIEIRVRGRAAPVAVINAGAAPSVDTQ